MPRVHKRKARKDYPKFGIKRGDVHYVTSLKTGPKSSLMLRQLKPFSRSQLTTSNYLKQIYDLEDSMCQAIDLSNIEDYKETYESIRDECQESFDNLTEGLQQGPTGQLLEERISACDEAIAELESIESDYDSSDEADQKFADLLDRLHNVSAEV